MRIVFDTNVVRGFGEREVDLDGLFALRAEGVRFHLASGSAVELTAQVLEGRFHWDRWVRARRLLRMFLAPGCAVLVTPSQKSSLRLLDVPGEGNDQALFNAGWKIMDRAARAADLTRLSSPYRGKQITLDAEKCRAVVKATRESWIAAMEGFEEEALGAVPNLKSAVPVRGEAIEGLQFLAARQAERLAVEYPGQQPPVASRWDALYRVFCLHCLRCVRPDQKYNPRKHANDSFDHALLRYLSIPSAICTTDDGIFNDLKAAGAWQIKWVVKPEHLRDRKVRSLVANLEWPTVEVAGR